MTDGESHSRTDRPLLPCPICGADAWGGEDTTTEIERDFQFGGQQATHEVPAKVCPDCGEVFPL